MPYIETEKMQSHLEEEIEECGDSTAENNPIAYGTTLGLKMALSYTKTLSTSDVAPVVHAHWIKVIHEKLSGCSNCSSYVEEEIDRVRAYFHFCPTCGAKMDEEIEGDNYED